MSSLVLRMNCLERLEQGSWAPWRVPAPVCQPACHPPACLACLPGCCRTAPLTLCLSDEDEELVFQEGAMMLWVEVSAQRHPWLVCELFGCARRGAGVPRRTIVLWWG